ncbi:MAG: PLDc N-terminal domain-containing protein [Desulfuromonadales bacterium]|jgi:hypothetical protein
MGMIIGIIIIIADIWAIVQTVQSSVPAGQKAVWVVVICVLPVLGLLLWLFLGPRTLKA